MTPFALRDLVGRALRLEFIPSARPADQRTVTMVGVLGAVDGPILIDGAPHYQIVMVGLPAHTVPADTYLDARWPVPGPGYVGDDK